MERRRLRTFVDIPVSLVAIGILVCPVIVSAPRLINGDEVGAAETAPATSVAGTAPAPSDQKIEKARDVYYKTEGIVSSAPEINLAML